MQLPDHYGVEGGFWPCGLSDHSVELVAGSGFVSEGGCIANPPSTPLLNAHSGPCLAPADE